MRNVQAVCQHSHYVGEHQGKNGNLEGARNLLVTARQVCSAWLTDGFGLVHDRDPAADARAARAGMSRAELALAAVHLAAFHAGVPVGSAAALECFAAVLERERDDPGGESHAAAKQGLGQLGAAGQEAVAKALAQPAYDAEDPRLDHTAHAIERDEAGDGEGAMLAFAAAARFAPDEAANWFNLATALGEHEGAQARVLGKEWTAAMCMAKATELDPSVAEGYGDEPDEL
jgi:tetratricopeptide (TPR) repeat protein